MLEGFPRMMQKVQIPDGTYSARVYQIPNPDSMFDSWARKRVGANAALLVKLRGLLTAFSLIGLLASAVSFIFLTWTMWIYIVGTTIACAVLAAGLNCTPGCRAMGRAWREFKKEYPDYVVALE
jgi:hypothetical protein